MMREVSPSLKDRDEPQIRVRPNPNQQTIGVKITGGEEVFCSIRCNKICSGPVPILYPQILKSIRENQSNKMPRHMFV
jgi:hypothetical protein